ncbi:MAG TPA: hypothetical protein VGG71_08105, partial [Chitinophagaceae bacterium]
MEKKVNAPVAEKATGMSKKIRGIKLNNLAPAQLNPMQKAKRIKSKGAANDALVKIPPPDANGPQVFSATADVFGKTAVSANSVEGTDQNDVTFAFATDNFTFDQIFKDFVNDNNSLFVFDDVSIQLTEKQGDDAATNELNFTGTLRMDQEPLTTLRDFLKCDTGLLVRGTIDTSGEDISEKITPGNVTLASVVTFLLSLADGIILKSAELNVELAQADGKWTFTESING